MGDLSTVVANPCEEQKAIRDKCFHPSGIFVEFKKEEIEQSIPDRFETIVAKYPDRIAVKSRSHEFTYNELNKMANRAARVILAQRGEGNEPVALLLKNDAQMIVATLCALKAGKISLPIDTSHPRARITHILEDSQAAFLLTDSENFPLANKLARTGLQVCNMEEPQRNFFTDNIGLSVSPNTLGLIRYTSGSTGEPKGVFDNHRNILFQAMNNTNGFHICSQDRIHAQRYDFFSALLNGASFYPLDIKEEGLSTLAEWLNRNEITIYCSVPPVFRAFLSTLTGEEKFSNLRLIRLEGELPSKRDVEMYKKYFSQSCILVNGLGCREAGGIRRYFIDKKTEINGNMVPAGYAIQDKEVLLLGDDGKEVGFNQIGEIAVRSRYLRLGYWRKPELTRATFLPDPNGGDESIYLTGDLGQMLPDGCLEYLGRKDLQVKIRGYRVEVTEIETLLLELPAVKEAAVVARGDVGNEKQLVAYIVATHDPVPSISELRRSLRQKLPDYMVPSNFVVMDALPLTLNGKLDRRALPEPGKSRPDLDAPFVAPRTPVEEQLAQIWAEVLDLDQVGIHDNFLDLGGNSLMATQVISRVRDAFQVELPLRSLFETPTVADLAVAIVQTQADEETARLLREMDVISDQEAQRRLAQTMQGKES